MFSIKIKKSKPVGPSIDIWKSYYQAKAEAKISTKREHAKIKPYYTEEDMKEGLKGSPCARDLRNFRRIYLKSGHNPGAMIWEKHDTVVEVKMCYCLSCNDGARPIIAHYRSLKNSIRRLRERRRDLRQDDTFSKNYDIRNKFLKARISIHDWPTYDLVRLKPGAYIEMLNHRKSVMVFEDKSPPLGNEGYLNRYVGIEIECISEVGPTPMAIAFGKAGLVDYVTLKEDGSLRPSDEEYGHEVCILAKQSEYKDIVKRVLMVLVEQKAKVNHSCGLHVHIDCRDDLNAPPAAHVYNNLMATQNMLYKMQPKRRRENMYCRPGRKREITEGKLRQGHWRYRGINPASLKRHGTIEVRIHSGTINESKIINWIDILLSIAMAGHIDKTIRTLKGMRNILPPHLLAYMKSRIKKFKTEVAEIDVPFSFEIAA